MDGNNIINEGEIYEGLCHQGSIVGSTAVLFDDDNFSGPVLKNHKGKEKDSKPPKLVLEKHMKYFLLIKYLEYSPFLRSQNLKLLVILNYVTVL